MLASLMAGVAIVEVALRILRPLAVAIVHQPCVYVEDPVLGYRYLPGATGWIHRHFEIDNVVKINSLGFHDVERSESPPAGPRILVVGDSQTAAIYLETNQTWTQVLEAELQSAHPGLEVINIGLDGTGTDVHIDLLKRFVPRLRPDLVVLAFYRNDLGETERGRFRRECYKGYVLAFQSENQRRWLRAVADQTRRRTTARWLFERFYLFRALTLFHLGNGNPLRMNFLVPPKVQAEQERNARHWQPPSLERVFRELADLSRRYDYDFVIAPVPAVRDIRGDVDGLRKRVPSFESVVLDLSPEIMAMLREEQLSYRALFWRHDIHLNGAGNRVFGRALARALADRL